jgi:hypothetical protein
VGGLAARGALVAAVAALAAGCGGSHVSSQQKALSAYLQQVNAVDKSMIVAVQRVNAAYLRFRGGKTTPSSRQLRTAEATILTIRDRVAAIDAPPAAATVHRDLLRLFTDDALVAHELTQMVAFLPPFQKSGGSFVAAHRELSTGLRTAKKPAAEAAVLERYAARCQAQLAALRGLTPPAVLMPLYASRILHLQKSDVLATELATALRRHERARVPGLSMRLEALEGGVEELNGANAESIAVAAYTRRLDEIQRLENRISRELTKLQTG